MNELHLRIFIAEFLLQNFYCRIFIAAFCVGCLFGNLIFNNKLQLFQSIFVDSCTLTASCFIGESACRNVVDYRWSNHM